MKNYNYDTVANQKTVSVNGAEKNRDSLYAKISIQAMEIAMAELKDTTFKIWMYLAKNQHNYTFALSKVDCCCFCKISDSSYHRGIKELIDNGYLVNDEGNHYNFYEMKPEEKEIEITVKKEDRVYQI